MAIALFGFESGAALATVVDVLIVVPVMLMVTNFVNSSRVWHEAKPGIQCYGECCPAAVVQQRRQAELT